MTSPKPCLRWFFGNALVAMLCASAAFAEVKNVPEDFRTIQSAIDAAQTGDVVLVAPGVYHESLRIEGKSITLASRYYLDEDSKWIRRTTLDGSIWPDPDPDDDKDAVVDQVIFIGSNVGEETAIVGFTIRDGDDGISCHGHVQIHHNRFVNNTDGIDYEGGADVVMEILLSPTTTMASTWTWIVPS